MKNMKKFAALFFSAVMVTSCSVQGSAYEMTKDIDVYANYVRAVEGEHVTELEEGAASLTTEDGIEIEAWGAPEGAVSLIVVPVPAEETDAWRWIQERMEGVAEPAHVFAVYFLNQNGDQLDADGAEVSVYCEHCGGNVVIYSLAADGRATLLTNAGRSVSITFLTNGSEYYVMAENTAEPTATPTPEPTPEVTATPTPEPTPEVTGTPTPEPTPEVTGTPTPEPTPTPELTATPTPEPTATPSQAPAVSVTATPSQAPAVSVTATPTEDPEKTPATGDENRPELWFTLMFASAAALLGTKFKKKEQ